LWFYALRRLKSGAPLSIRNHHITIGITLVFFGLAASLACVFRRSRPPVLVESGRAFC
jgi:hypothetical protein